MIKFGTYLGNFYCKSDRVLGKLLKKREILKLNKKKSNTNTNNKFLPFIWPFIGKFSAYFCPFQQVLKNKKTIYFFFLAVFGLFLAFVLSFCMHSASIYCPFFKLIFISQFSRLVFSFISPFFSLFVCIKKKCVTFLSKHFQFST